MTEMVSRLFYRSRSLLDKSDKVNLSKNIIQILKSAQMYNQPIGLTGGLYFNGERFGQILEGSLDTVEQAMIRIVRDPRHTDIEIQKWDTDVPRAFGDWSMAMISRLDQPALSLHAPEDPEKNEAGWLVTPEQFDLINEIKSLILEPA